MKNKLFLLVLLFGLAGYAGTQEVIPKITIQDFSQHLMHYFENKNDAIIYEIISIYENKNYNEMLEQIDNRLLYFFYGIKTDNINRYNNFMAIITKRKLQRVIGIFDVIENLDDDIEWFLDLKEPDSEMNDIYWTLFFSTGNVKYINNLITTINKYYNETKYVNSYLAARTAMWSMALNIKTYPLVREYFLKSNIKNTLKDYILNTSPDKIQNETVEFIRQQREKGVW